MSNLERLTGLYRDDRRVGKLLSILAQNPQARIRVPGMSGSQVCFVLRGAWLARPQAQLFIADDKESAAYLQNTLTALFDGKPVHLMPDSFKRPLDFDNLNADNVLQRTEIINRMTRTNAERAVIVTYPEALFEKVVSPKVLDEHRVEVAVGERLDVDFLAEVLTEYGFVREDFVYEPGQFSIRGGIVDIFSYGNEYPYRLDLFDEDVESIRTFNPATQRSVRDISRVSIVPNVNTRFTEAQKVSLLQILPEHTVVWASDLQLLLDKLLRCGEKAAEFATHISEKDESEQALFFRDRAFIAPADVVADLGRWPTICLATGQQPLEFDATVPFDGRPQPRIGKQFDLLIQSLRQNTAQGIENYIFTDNVKQVERFYAVFEDLRADVQFHPITEAIHEGFVDADLKIACYTDHQIFDRFHRYKLRQGFTKDQALNVRFLQELKPGDYVTHLDHGVGRYSGLEKININGKLQESVRLFYQNNDILYVSINSLHKISKYTAKEGVDPKLSKLGSDAWRNLKNRTKKKMKDMAGELIKLYAQRKATPGFAFSPDGYLQNELESSFIYEDTPDQLKATIDVKDDMMKPYPMDRLICGDVGFGKTEVAIRAAFKAVTDGKQVAILVPTTILALQHYRTFRERMDEFGATVDYINRFRTAGQRKAVFKDLKEGKIDIVIGTHGILSKDVGFKDLGLLIIDEEQKFGVAAKEKLRNLKVNVDTLTLTATPIPRTLQFSLMAARDLSLLRTPPPNRQPIHTEVRVFSEELVRDSIYYEVNRGGQVFFVHNRVKSLPDMVAMIRRLCPDVKVAMAHGQMEAQTLESTLVEFIDKQHDVLVCTNIIETGLDIANANTMIINDAHNFGLSDLHQLRGRVGRSNTKAFCYLFSQPSSVLSTDARKRLQTLEEHSELGSGFEIAMRDLDIRGAGNLLGAEQSGFIADIGYEMYQKILAEAMQELKETDFKDLFKDEMEKNSTFVRDVQIDTDLELLIPDDYVANIQERLSLYTQLDNIEDEAALQVFADTFRDRFGRLPEQVIELFDGLRLRWLCKSLGFERVVLKGNKLRSYFVENPQSAFYESAAFQQIMQRVSTEGPKRGFSLKQSGTSLILIKEQVRSMKQARKALEMLLQEEVVA